MRKLLLLFLITFTISKGQQQPPVTPTAPCVIPFFINSTGTGANGHFQPSTTGFDNRQAGCSNWNIQYSSTGYTVISLRVESAPPGNNVAPGTPGTYVAFAGTLVSGINPNTAITEASSTFSGYFPWIRINASTLTGTGVIVGVLIGTQPIPVSGGGSSSGGCVGTAATPCVVDGPTASGSAPTKPPVMIAGWDTLNVRTLITNPQGGQIPAGGGSPDRGDNVNFSNVQTPLLVNNGGTQGAGGFPIISYVLDGSSQNFNRTFACTLSLGVTLTTSGLTRIITNPGFQTIRICSLTLSFASPVDIRLVEGTQVMTACDTGPTNMTGLFRNVVGFDPSWGTGAALIEGVANDDVCISMSANVNGGGVVTYAVF